MGQRRLESWAATRTPADAQLHWWETAASAGSSLGLFALFSAAADPALTEFESLAIEDAYWPWIGALHSLLDSAADRAEDEAANHQSLLAYYPTLNELGCRFRLLACEAKRAGGALDHGERHLLILAAMASHYISTFDDSPMARLVATAVTESFGRIMAPTNAVIALRRAADVAVFRDSR